MLGTVVEDRYLIEAELGEGAMGRVYRARHIKVGRLVAIKVMRSEHAKHVSIVERFEREAMIAARLRHPNLVAVLDVGTTADGAPMIVMELAPGDKLANVIDGPLPRERVVTLLAQLLRGLDHAHAAGLIHRDLKPDNILVETTDDGRELPRIVDFGIAVAATRDDTVAGRRLTDANMVIGTPFYMSPEQARAKDLDSRTDLFSLGVIAYEMLSGMPPFPGTSVDVALANASKDPPAIGERAGIHVDPLLEWFARKLMARRREDRFQSAREALAMLELIERDRIAAARAISGGDAPAPASPAKAPTPVPVLSPSKLLGPQLAPNSDVLMTHPVTAITKVERRTRLRITASAGLAIATAALVIAGWSHSTIVTHAPAIEIAAVADAELGLRVTAAEPAPPRFEAVVTRPRTQARRVEVAPSAAAPVVTAAVVPAPVVAAPPEQELAEAKPAVVVVPAAFESPDSAGALAARYKHVGKLLRGKSAALWDRYRRIRINEAFATAQTRRDALLALDQIERAIR
jgi:serine/threonine-protein kinase